MKEEFRSRKQLTLLERTHLQVKTYNHPFQTTMRWTCSECVKRRDYPSHYDSSTARPTGRIALRAIHQVEAIAASNDSDGCLSLHMNEIVRLEFQRDDGWWYGTSSSSHQGGWFPSGSVDFLPGFKLGVARCVKCFVSNPSLVKQLPGVCTSTTAATPASSSTMTQYNKNVPTSTCFSKTIPLPLIKKSKSPRTITNIPSFSERSAYATALHLNTSKSMTKDLLISIKPMASPLKIQSTYGPLCQHLEILSLSPLLLKLEGFLDGPTCRSLISAAYQRGFSSEESGCHGDDEEDDHNSHEGHHHEPPRRNETVKSCTNPKKQNKQNQQEKQEKQEKQENIKEEIQSRDGAGRTSTACWLRKYDYDTSDTSTEAPQMIAYEDRAAFVETELKISNLSNFPISHQEPLQVVRYFPGQQFVPHMDWIESYKEESWGGRVITVLIYLQAPKEGGSTTFPKLDKEGKYLHKKMNKN